MKKVEKGDLSVFTEEHYLFSASNSNNTQQHILFRISTKHDIPAKQILDASEGEELYKKKCISNSNIILRHFCSLSVILYFSNRTHHKKPQKGCKHTTILKTFCIFALCDTK